MLPPAVLIDEAFDMVRTSLTTSLAAGVDIEIVSDRLGHSTSAVTRAIYLHPVAELDRRAADTVAGLIPGPSISTAGEDRLGEGR
jgi:integrase